MTTRPPDTDLRHQALAVLLIADADAKATKTRALDPLLPLDPTAIVAEPSGVPGRPQRPLLVDPKSLATRDVKSSAGRAALLHALAHIEFNAINLALDAVWRFAGLPEAFYRDWLLVAREEALHFELLRDHLCTLGHAYGDFPAHDGLWTMAERTRADVLARMALVPRTLEARGLDAAPPIRRKLAAAGDQRAAEILDVILRDEVGHVAIGNRWFRWLCLQRGISPLTAYAELAAEHRAPQQRGPFNVEARRAAGFDDEEIARLEAPHPRG